MDLGFLPGWLERIVSGLFGRRAVGVRVADEAKMLARQLRATYEDWPNGPAGFDQLQQWAVTFETGYPHTEPAVKKLVELRPGAPRRKHKAIGTARDRYYDAADIVNRLRKEGRLSVYEPASQDLETKLRNAYQFMQACLDALAKVEGK